ncbi:hypothetical protein SBRCBS47491_009826 [Sporothrix bragantina]|uniref:pectinesterase n=1 Tax=Sporothrix bragantina TaxID=671064 RepID=A0ABP0CXX8_9PEZI
MIFSRQLAQLALGAASVGSVSAMAVHTSSVDYALCQYPTPNLLEGCPEGTIVVGSVASHRQAHFSTIQDAIGSLPNNTETYTILVLAGNYTEQLNITRQAPLRLLGQTKNPTDQTQNLVTVYWASANGAGSGFDDNAYTAVLTVAPTLNASLTGSGPTGFAVPEDTPFGNEDMRIYNMDFRNVYAEQTAGASLAISISRANAGLYHCGIYSYQDTVYVGHLGNAYLYGCEVAGETDFLYGFGTAWLEACQVSLRGCGGGVVAWKGTNTTFANENKYGCYIARSRVTAANASVAANNVHRCSLGRPWNAQHRSVYIDTYMDACILPQGYTKWGSTAATSNYNNYTLMAEYESFGPGWNATARLAGNVTKILDRREERPYACPVDVFMTQEGKQPNVAWIDARYSSC